MKKRIILLLTLTVLLLSGCTQDNTVHADTYCFFYPRADILYGAQDSVITGEIQDISMNSMPVEQVLSAYLSGPKTEGLVSPFPEGTHLLAMEQQSEKLTLTLSDVFFTLEGMDLTLACASLSKTCFTMTDATEISLRSQSGDQRIELDRDSFIYSDSHDSIEMTIGTEPAQ